MTNFGEETVDCQNKNISNIVIIFDLNKVN